MKLRLRPWLTAAGFGSPLETAFLVEQRPTVRKPKPRAGREDYLRHRLPDSAIQRIIDSVGADYTPHSLIPGALAFELTTVLSLYERRRVELQSLSSATTGNLREISRLAARLRKTLRKPNVRQSLHSALSETSSQHRKILGLEPIEIHHSNFGSPLEVFDEKQTYGRIVAAVSVLTDCSQLATSTGGSASRSSLNKRLIGQDLPRIFEVHFQRKIGRSRSNDQQVGGPGVRFILAVLDEANIRQSGGKPYTAETVAKYVGQRGQTKPTIG